MKKIGKSYQVLYLGFLVIGILMLILVWNHGNTQVGYYDNFKITEINQGWFLSESKENVELPINLNRPKEVYTDISRILEEDTKEDEVICFRTDYSFVRAYADGKLIYSFGEKEEIPFGKTPGSIWNIIPLSGLKAGTEITISVMCPYNMYSGKFRTIVQGERADVILYIFRDCAPLLLMCVMPMVVAVFLFIIQIIFYRNFKSLVFFNAGICFTLLTIWSFTEARAWQFFGGDAYLLQMINFVSFSIVILSIAFSMKQMHFIMNEKHFRIMMIVDIVIPISQILIQLLGIADFFEMLTVIHIMDAVNLFVFMTDFVIASWKTGKKHKNIVWSIVMYTSTIGCLALDLADFYIWDKFGNGFFSRIELLVMMIVAGICTVKKSITIYGENIEKKTYERMAYTDDMTQMRNRRAFDRDVEQFDKNNTSVTILYVDMNGLKQINDCMGHQKGDEAIGHVAEKLLYFQKQGNFCYRLGGDEFCVLGVKMSGEKMEAECERINQELRELDGTYVHPLSIAYGAEEYHSWKNEDIFHVMKRADKKMYKKKKKMKR